MRTFLAVLVLLVAGAGAAWYYAGTQPGPKIEILEPTKGVGQSGQLAVEVAVPRERLQQLDIWLEQNGERKAALFSLSDGTQASMLTPTADKVRVTRTLGKQDLPDLQAGQARIVVAAVSPVLFGLRAVSASADHEFEVHLTPPPVSVQSIHHFINQGGSEVVVYRTAAGAKSGVRVGDKEYPGFPASGAGIAGASPELHVAFFALLWNQDPSTQISLFARDDYGNESRATFDYKVIPKKFRQSRIPLDDRFLGKVVPAILASTPDFKVQDPADLVASFLAINRDLRQQNNATITELAKHSSPRILWQDTFKQLANTAVEAGFADQRSYIYRDQSIDQQTHLGFDLASTTNAPVHASNSGTVVLAGWLGIYGNCVIIDHGMGLQSLYGHLSSIAVKVGDQVASNQELGRTGATGMAGGDHLHFTMLLNGNAVTPVDWWSKQWIQDRIIRKFREADVGAPVGTN
jgi:murein DD-endopeptidase MepM/ murein hydrolase activator NlpD